METRKLNFLDNDELTELKKYHNFLKSKIDVLDTDIGEISRGGHRYAYVKEVRKGYRKITLVLKCFTPELVETNCVITIPKSRLDNFTCKCPSVGGVIKLIYSSEDENLVTDIEFVEHFEQRERFLKSIGKGDEVVYDTDSDNIIKDYTVSKEVLIKLYTRLNINGLHKPKEKSSEYRCMFNIYKSCERMGIEIPNKVLRYFGDKPPCNKGKHIWIGDNIKYDSNKKTYFIDVKSLPKEVDFVEINIIEEKEF